MTERLQSVAICYALPKGGSHGDLRIEIAFGSEAMTCDGFLTDAGRFVNRREAVEIGVISGQLAPMWRVAERYLLSTDINWEGGK